MHGMPAAADARFLTYISELMLCSRCLRKGRRTPIRQVISHRHRPLSLCRGCREQSGRMKPASRSKVTVAS